MSETSKKGKTEKAKRTRERILQSALSLFETRGYSNTTLRQIAADAGVSLGLVYRYFESKEAFVLTLYDHLSARFEVQARERMVEGRWAERTMVALRTSLDVLGPHREALKALLGVMMKDVGALYPPTTAHSLDRVQALFDEAVAGATDAPAEPEVLGKNLYVLHLMVLLFWQLDQSTDQRSTERLVAFVERYLPIYAFLLLTPPVRELSEIIVTAVFGPLANNSEDDP